MCRALYFHIVVLCLHLNPRSLSRENPEVMGAEVVLLMW